MEPVRHLGDGRLLYVNRRACENLGYSREELLELTVHDVNPSLPREGWRETWRKSAIGPPRCGHVDRGGSPCSLSQAGQHQVAVITVRK